MMVIEAAPKGLEAYEWFTWKGEGIYFQGEAGNRVAMLNRGDNFGVRPSGNGKKIRLVTEELGTTKVFTISLSLAQQLAKKVKPMRNVKKLRDVKIR